MYFVKTKKLFDQQECKELQAKKEKIAERQQKDGTSSAAVSSPTKRGKNEKSDSNGFLEDELPDGACFRPKVIASEVNNDNDVSAVRSAEYIGSFSVSGSDQNARTEFVQKEMEKMRTPDKSKNIMLVISLTGVKVCSSNGESVFMAHALKRISYATCEPEFRQFSFLAREPKGHIDSQFCHVFMTKTPDEAEELNTLIGNAFKMAYAQQRVKQPTFNELIEKQLVEQKQKYQEYQEHAQKMFQQRLQEIATPTPFSERAQQHMEMRRQSSSEDTADNRDIISGKNNKLWAKHQVDRIKHRTPGLDNPQDQQSGPAPTTSPPPRPLSDAPSSNLSRPQSEIFVNSTPTGRPQSEAFINSTPTGRPQSEAYTNSGPTGRPQSEAYTNSTPTGRPQSEAFPINSRYINQSGPKRNITPQTSPIHQNTTSSKRSSYANTNNSRSPPHQRICSPGRVSNGQSERTMKSSPVHKRVCSPRRNSPTRSTGSVRSSYDNVSTSSRSQTANSRNSPVDTLAQLRFDQSNNSNKGKGSPVTALKEAIDRGFLNDGHAIARDIAQSHGICIQDPNEYLQPKNSKEEDKANPNLMVNRPLPAIPKETGAQNGHSGKTKNWTSLDDDALTPQHRVQMRRDNLRDSPKRRQPRPHSEVFADHKFVDLDGPGCYMYGSRSQVHQQVARSRSSEGQQQKLQNYGLQLQMQYQSGPLSSQMKYQNGGESSYEYADESAMCDKNRPGLEALMGLDRSHIQDETLRHASWYQAGIPREIALEILQQEDIGSFIVRDSTTHPGCYALSVRVPKYDNPTGISHYLILKTQRGVKLKGLDKEWPDLLALVTHHTVMPEMLPCTLRLPHKSKNPTYKDNDKDEKDEDPDYQRLSDFTSMMEALKK
ncbi:uncharacterized protein LOC134692964 isoform X2 [Mytilus trossulus]|uniref:uncharacterized protein LOC134692964 isoform X2 n=1 Tax=Mytilus trossulus TaxID=6551 RepID=UPI003005914F